MIRIAAPMAMMMKGIINIWGIVLMASFSNSKAMDIGTIINERYKYSLDNFLK
jgi:hypothetical protein